MDTKRKEKKNEPTSLNILPANETDIEEILKIEEKSWLSTYPNEGYSISVEDVAARFENPNDSFIRESMANTNHDVFILREKSETVGYLHLMRDVAFNDLVQIYLTPKSQGKGIGKKAIEFALKKLGNDLPIRLQVAKYNTKAITLYEKYDFRITDLKQADGDDWNVLPSGQRIPILIMERSIKK